MATALVTGGTRGIGFAVVKTLLAGGHEVAFTGTTADGILRAEQVLAAEIPGAGSRVLGLTCDVRDRAAVHRAVDAAVQRFGRLGVLVNNAGVGVGGPIAELAPEEWSRILDTNLTGVFHCCQAAIPHLRAAPAELDRQHQQPGRPEPVRRRRRLLRDQGRARRLQRGADAGAPLRRDPGGARVPGVGRHRVQRPRGHHRRRLEAPPRRRRPGGRRACSRSLHGVCRAAWKSGPRSRENSRGC